jgi:hypothetical protein
MMMIMTMTMIVLKVSMSFESLLVIISFSQICFNIDTITRELSYPLMSPKRSFAISDASPFIAQRKRSKSSPYMFSPNEYSSHSRSNSTVSFYTDWSPIPDAANVSSHASISTWSSRRSSHASTVGTISTSTSSCLPRYHDPLEDSVTSSSSTNMVDCGRTMTSCSSVTLNTSEDIDLHTSSSGRKSFPLPPSSTSSSSTKASLDHPLDETQDELELVDIINPRADLEGVDDGESHPQTTHIAGKMMNDRNGNSADIFQSLSVSGDHINTPELLPCICDDMFPGRNVVPVAPRRDVRGPPRAIVAQTPTILLAQLSL